MCRLAEKKKEEKKIEEEPVPTELEALIEYQRARLKTRTPVTLDRLQVWLKAKKDKKKAEEDAKMGSAKADLARGKRVQSLTGKELFSVEPTLFVDDEAANEERLEDRHLSLEEEDDGERLFVGMNIKALYMGGGEQWYSGVVRAINADGTYDVEFEDGEHESQVKREHIEIIEESESESESESEDESDEDEDDEDEDDGGEAAAPAAASAAAAVPPGKAPVAAPATAAADAAAALAVVDLADVDEDLFAGEDDDLPED